MEKVKRQPMYKEIKDYLAEIIERNRSNPNYLLPSENQLCMRFNTSRVTVRKALEELEAEQLIYRQHGKGSFINRESSAEPLQSKAALTFAVVLPEIKTNFVRDIVMGIEKFCAEYGCDYFLTSSFSIATIEERNIALARRLGAKGIILMPVDNDTYNNELLNLIVHKIPSVFIDRKLVGLDIPCISSDHFEMGRRATEYLLSRKHTHIAMLTLDDRISAISDRTAGYLSALSDLPASARHILDISGPESFVLCEKMIAYFRTHPEISGIIANSGFPAAYAVQAMKTLEKQAGKDFELVVFDNDNAQLSITADAPIAAILQDCVQIGYSAVETLYNQIRFGTVPPKITTVPLLNNFAENL